MTRFRIHLFFFFYSTSLITPKHPLLPRGQMSSIICSVCSVSITDQKEGITSFFFLLSLLRCVYHLKRRTGALHRQAAENTCRAPVRVEINTATANTARQVCF